MRAQQSKSGATWPLWRIAALAVVAVAGYARPGLGAEASDGKAILERNCGRCHAVTAGSQSPLKEAPNLWTVLGYYPTERLELELAEGIGSRHRDMPQIQSRPRRSQASITTSTMEGPTKSTGHLSSL